MPDSWPAQWRDAIQLCLRAEVKPKDRAFLSSISKYANRPSIPQLVWRRGIVERVLERSP
jgi:hypothetical protein